MIYDCFTFNNELDILKIRLEELSGTVDKFVLVEATTTFTGKSKKLFYLENKSEFIKFQHNIIHIVVDDIGNAPPADTLAYYSPKVFQIENPETWAREIYQRNCIRRGLNTCRDNDIILISDVDEIPKAVTLRNLKINNGLIGLEQGNYNYFLNCKCSEAWIGTKAGKFSTVKSMDPEEIRESANFRRVPQGGWHFSFLGGIDAVTDKIKSFSHQEHNKPDFLKKNTLKHNIENGLDIFNRPFKNTFVKIDRTYPEGIYANQDKYAKYIWLDEGVSPNVEWLRDETFSARTALYWKELELTDVISKMRTYQNLYRQSARLNPLWYAYKKMKEIWPK